MRYTFEYDEIVCCSECPFFYDLITCLLNNERKAFTDFTWLDDGHRPDWCPLMGGVFDEKL